MKKLSIIKKLLISTCSCLLIVTSIHAGSSDCACTEEDIKREISYLAKKLLDLSGESSYEVSSDVYLKPYIGYCYSSTVNGVLLTCVTPGREAAKAGLKTGDIITSFSGVNLVNADLEIVKHKYHKLIDELVIGEKLQLVISRNKESINLEVIVGELSHPAYVLTVEKK